MNSNSQNPYHLYILRCAKGKYYVGITTKTPATRLWEHQHKVRPAYWTMKYEPIEVIYAKDLGNTTKLEAEKHENKMIRACIKKYGINNVRGGDLKDTREYVRRFGYIFVKENWDDVVYILYMLVLLGIFIIDKYIVSFIPGGIR